MSGKRLAASIGILFVFGFGLWLRMSGLNWGLRENALWHPDERHVGNCMDKVRLAPVEPQGENEHYFSYLKRYWAFQIWGGVIKGTVDGKPLVQAPLRPDNFNYGTLPYFIYDLAATVFADPAPQPGTPPQRLVPFSTSGNLRLLIVLLVIWLSVYSARKVWKECRQDSISASGIPTAAYIAVYLALPVLGAVTFFGIPAFTEIADRTSLNHYGGALLIGRFITAWAGAASIYILWRMGRDAYGPGAGLLAAAMLATAVLHVQLSHFSTVDVLTGFFVLCALAQYLEAARKPRLIPYILGGVFTGFAIACKWSAITLPGVMLVAHACNTWGERRNGQLGRWLNSAALVVVGIILLHFYKAASSTNPLFNVALADFRDFYVGTPVRIFGVILGFVVFIALGTLFMLQQNWWEAKEPWTKTWLRFFAPWFFLLLFIPVVAGALFVGQPFTFTEAGQFARDLTTQNAIIVTGDMDLTWNRQYEGTAPFFYLLDNLFYPSLDWFTAAAVIAGVIFAIRCAIVKRKKEDLILLAWIVPSFLLYSTFYCKFPRYMALILPPMLLLAARFLVAMLTVDPRMYHPTLARYPAWLVRAIRPAGWACIALCLLASTSYAYAYVRDVYWKPHTATEYRQWAQESGNARKNFVLQTWDETTVHRHRVGFHEGWDDERKLNEQIRGGNRWELGLADADGLTLLSKRAYGTTFRFPEKYATTNTLFRLLFSEQLGYRIVKVIDRPIHIGPWKFYADTEDESFRVYDHPKIVVWENIEHLPALQMIEMIKHPPDWVNDITHEQILTIRDGKTVFDTNQRHPLLRWLFVTELLGIFAFLLLFRWAQPLPDRGYAFSKVIGTALFSWLSWILASSGIAYVSQSQLLFCFVLIVVLALLVMHKHWCEVSRFVKEHWGLLLVSELVFLSFLYWFLSIRMDNAAVHWGEKPMDMAFLSAIFRAETFPTADPWISGRSLSSYYYYGFVFLGLPARLAGCLPATFYNIAVCAIPAFMATAVFGLVYALTRSWKAGLLGSFLAVLCGNPVSFTRIFFCLDDAQRMSYHASNPITWDVFWDRIYTVVLLVKQMFFWSIGLGQAVPNGEHLFAFHPFYWRSAHTVIFGCAANEFPAWTYLFADLHAHAIVMPIGVAFLGGLYCWYRNDAQNAVSVWGRLLWASILALLLGTIATTNTWNLPGCALILALTLWLAYRERNQTPMPQTRPGWMTPEGLSRLSYLLFIPVVVGTSRLLFLPYHMNFNSRVQGAGFMQEGQTPFHTYLLFFGILLFPIVLGLVWFTLFPDGRLIGSVKRIRELGPKRKTLLGILTFCGALLAILVTVAAQMPDAQGGSYWRFALLFQLIVNAVLGGLLGYMAGLGIVLGPGPWRRLLMPAILALICLIGAAWINSSLPIQFAPDHPLTKLAASAKLLNNNTLQLRDIASGGARELREGATGFDATTPAFIFFFLIFAGYLSLIRKQVPEQRFVFLIIFLALGISFGAELIYMREGWSFPSHRWNTAFKFFLIVWNLMSLAAACCVCWLWRAWRTPVVRPSHKMLRTVCRWSVPPLFGALLYGGLAFAVIAPFTMTQPGDSPSKFGPQNTLDGMAFIPTMRGDYGPDDYRIISWLNWRTGEERPTILEYTGSGYDAGSRISVFTGLPTVIGWPHHVGERGNLDQKAPRERDVSRVYSTDDESEFRELLAKYDVRYLILGSYEKKKLGSQGIVQPITRWLQWGHLLDLVYHTGDAWIFQPRTNLNEPLGVKTRKISASSIEQEAESAQETGQPLQVGGEGSRNGEFRQPKGIAVSPKGLIYVADMLNHRVQIFRPDGQYEGKFGQEGEGPGEFKEPRDIGIDADGNIYVCDTWNHRIQIFDATGHYQRIIDAGFYGPRGIYVDSVRKQVLVADTGGHQVCVFGLDGKLIRRLGRIDRAPGSGPGELAEPRAVTTGNQGEIYVVDWINRRIAKYDPQGKFMKSWDIEFAQNIDENHELRLVIGPDNRLYITDPVGGRIVYSDLEGRTLGSFDRDNLTPNKDRIGEPGGLAWTPNNVLLFSDLRFNRVRPIVIPGVTPNNQNQE